MSKNVEILYVGNDMVLEVSDVTNALTGAALTGATVSVTLLDEAGASVSGETWPKVLSHVTAQFGTYRGTLPYSLDLAEYDRVQVVVEIDGGVGLRARFVVPAVVQARGA